MGKGSNSASSSSINSTNRMARSRTKRDYIGTDLQLALGFPGPHHDNFSREQLVEVDESDNATFYVKVYMEGIPIGRKLDLLAHDGYFALVTTMNYMFNTAILWSEEDGAQAEGCHVLTYEDREGDWLMVGDVPWEDVLVECEEIEGYEDRIAAIGCFLGCKIDHKGLNCNSGASEEIRTLRTDEIDGVISKTGITHMHGVKNK